MGSELIPRRVLELNRGTPRWCRRTDTNGVGRKAHIAVRVPSVRIQENGVFFRDKCRMNKRSHT